MASHPMLYLLCGLPCSGKTTHARRLESTGIMRVSVDEMLVASSGRLGIDYPHADHAALLAPIVAAAREHVARHLAAGDDVVLDHGLGRRVERDEFKQLAETHDAAWQLLCFEAGITTLRARCKQRFTVSGTVPISSETLDYLAAEWERPSGEGETIVVTD